MSRRTALKAVGLGAAALTVGFGPGIGTASAATGSTPGDLTAALGDKVLFPGDPGYAAACASFNTIIQQTPNAIVLAETAQDVATAVSIGSGIGWPIAVQATGHGMGVPANGALLINMSELNGVSIDAAQRTAQIEGGARWSDVINVAAPLGMLPPVGSTSNVGATGYVTGGGVSIVGRSYGYASDRVRSIELVTPDGRQRHLSPCDEPDLFWAVRGGKSNFGAVTSFEIDLLPAATVYGGGLTFPAASVEAAYQAYVAWTATVSDQMTSVASFIRYPDLPTLPPSLQGQLNLRIEVVYLGSAADGATAIAPLRALGPVTDTVAETPVAQLDGIFQVPTTPGATVTASGLIDSLDAAGADLVLQAIGPSATLPSGVIEVRHLGGAFARCPQTPNAIGHRNADYLVFLSNPAPAPTLIPSIEQSQQATLTQLGPLLSGGTVPTFLGTLDTTSQAVSTAYDPDAWERLLTLKHQYDPNNLFCINNNIR